MRLSEERIEIIALAIADRLAEQRGERLSEAERDTGEQAPFAYLGTGMPGEAHGEAQPIDPMDATGDGAALDEFIEVDANEADATP